MFDIEFVKSSVDLKKKIVNRSFTGDAIEALEKLRPKIPAVFQIETTNICNMKCVMCPRTTLMERKLGSMDIETFTHLIEQIEPHSNNQWTDWEEFVAKDFMKNSKTHEEDFFYFMICAKTLILHGFGEPILDKTLPEKIAIASKKGLPTYFSMNPVNIIEDKIIAIAEAGLDYLKLSLEGLDNETQMFYRGRVDKSIDITLNKIFKTIELYKERNYKTKIIITRLNFKDDENEQQEFLDFWSQYPVLVYVKNQHNRWLYKEENVSDNTAEYMQRYCEFPWSSVSVLYDGTVVPCPLDYDGILNMGNINNESLYDIWNGEKFDALRRMHVNGSFPEGHFCKKNCDYNQVYEFTNKQ
ncbi:MAG: radical SAM/SPASM domain-containing protein [Bacteroidia bacterium]